MNLVGRRAHPRHPAFATSGPPARPCDIAPPPGWSVTHTATGARRSRVPDDAGTGLYRLPVRLDGQDARDLSRIEHAHVAPTARARPAELRLRVLDVAVPDVRVGYIGAGNDRVDHWLAALGADVTALSDEDLASDAVLSGFDTIVIGIFAMRFRPGLAEAMPRLHRWTRSRRHPGHALSPPLGQLGPRQHAARAGSRSASPRCAGG